MKKWLRRIRGAVGMGLTWAVVWAVVAVLIGLLVDPDGSADEMWPAIGAYPGFLGGVVFSVVLAAAGRRRSLDDLSIGRVAAWGAGAGLLVGILPFTIGDPTTEIPLWQLAGAVIGTITALAAGSAAGSLALARRVEAGGRLDAGADLPGLRAGSELYREPTDRRDEGVHAEAGRSATMRSGS